MSTRHTIASAAICGILVLSGSGAALAGWGSFFRKDQEPCQHCQEQTQKQKKCAIGAEDPPVAAVVDVAAIRITNERAERTAPAPSPAAVAPVPPVPAVPAACTPVEAAGADSARVQRIEQELHNLRLQIQALTLILKEK